MSGAIILKLSVAVAMVIITQVCTSDGFVTINPSTIAILRRNMDQQSNTHVQENGLEKDEQGNAPGKNKSTEEPIKMLNNDDSDGTLLEREKRELDNYALEDNIAKESDRNPSRPIYDHSKDNETLAYDASQVPTEEEELLANEIRERREISEILPKIDDATEIEGNGSRSSTNVEGGCLLL